MVIINRRDFLADFLGVGGLWPVVLDSSEGFGDRSWSAGNEGGSGVQNVATDSEEWDGFIWPGRFDDYCLVDLSGLYNGLYLCEFDEDRHRVIKLEKGGVVGGYYTGLHSGEVRKDYFYRWIEGWAKAFS